MSKCPVFPFRFIIGSQTETDGRKHPLAGRVYMYLTSRITGGLSAPRSVSGFLGSGGIPGDRPPLPRRVDSCPLVEGLGVPSVEHGLQDLLLHPRLHQPFVINGDDRCS